MGSASDICYQCIANDRNAIDAMEFKMTNLNENTSKDTEEEKTLSYEIYEHGWKCLECQTMNRLDTVICSELRCVNKRGLRVQKLTMDQEQLLVAGYVRRFAHIDSEHSLWNELAFLCREFHRTS